MLRGAIIRVTQQRLLICTRHTAIHMKSTTAAMSYEPVQDVPVNKVRISPQLILRTLSNERQHTPGTRPLAVFFTWLYASPSAIDKYCELYHRRGMDVLSVACPLKNFLWPKKSQGAAKELLKYLSESKECTDRDILVHAMSIGAFFYTFVVMEMARNSGFGSVRNLIKAQVFDSLTIGSLDEMATGISKQSKNPLLQSIIRGGIHSYFFLTRPFTVKIYDQTVDFFKNQPLKTPILTYYGINDPMSNPQVMQDMIKLWTDEFGLDVTSKSWEKSVHAGHLIKHPEEYVALLNEFISRNMSSATPKSKL